MGRTVDDLGVTLGERYVAALASKDTEALKRLVSPDITLRGLTPGRSWEAHGPDEVADVLFGNWFEDSDHIESLLSIESGRVEDRYRVSYRLAVNNQRGSHLVEQQAYYDVVDSRIAEMSILCSGFRPTGSS